MGNYNSFRQAIPHIFVWLIITFRSIQISFSQNIDSIYTVIDKAAQEGRYLDMVKGYQEAISFYQKENQIEEYIAGYLDVAYAYKVGGDYPAMAVYLDTTKMKIAEANLAPLSWVRSYFWNLKGNYFLDRGFYPESIDAFKEVLHIDTLNGAADPNFDITYLGSDYQNIGVAYERNGDYQQAIQYNFFALKYFPEWSWQQANTYNSIAYQYQKKKDFGKAQSYYNKGLEILKKCQDSPENINFLRKLIFTNKATCFRDAEAYNEVFKALDKALSITAKEDRSTRSKIYQTKGVCLLLEDQYIKAGEALHNALDLRVKTLSTKHPNVGFTLKTIGDLYAKQNDLDQATQYYQKALVSLVWQFNDSTNIQVNPDIKQGISSRSSLLDVLGAKANALEKWGKTELALSNYDLALDLIDDMRINYQAEGSKYTLLEQVQPIYEGAIRTALALDEKEIAFQFAERSKAVVLLENIKKQSAISFAGLPDSLLKKEQDLNTEIGFYERSLVTAQRKEEEEAIDRYQNELFIIREKHQQLLERFEREYPDYYDLKYDLKVAGINEVQKRFCDSKTAVLQYFYGQEKLYLFMISKSKSDIVEVALEGLNEKILELRTILAKPDLSLETYEEYVFLGRDLYDLLLKKAISTMDVGINRLLIVPDGPLNYLPFHTLLQESDKKITEARYDLLPYLILNYTIGYSYSCTLLMTQKGAPGMRKKDVRVGAFAPVFERAIAMNRSEHLSKLVYSEDEVKGVNTIFNGQTYIKEQASLENFKRDLTSFSIIHLSTHAVVNDENQEEARIYFYDDYLSLPEIYPLPIRAKLTVLSACETNLGKLQTGEGVMSLARAFTYAGCPSILTSLWEVNDLQTSKLMQEFYTQLAEGNKKDISLCNAQRIYLQNIKSLDKAHPFYWAPFIHIGDDTALVRKPWNPIAGGLVGLVLGLILAYFYKKRKVKV